MYYLYVLNLNFDIIMTIYDVDGWHLIETNR